MVAISSTVGKDEKSSGRWIQSATMRMRTESAMEKASPTSTRTTGMGRNSTQRIDTMPNAKPTSRMLGLTLGKEMTGGCAIKSSCLFMRRATEKPPHGSAAPVF